jgi:hypothetical protein
MNNTRDLVEIFDRLLELAAAPICNSLFVDLWTNEMVTITFKDKEVFRGNDVSALIFLESYILHEYLFHN